MIIAPCLSKGQTWGECGRRRLFLLISDFERGNTQFQCLFRERPLKRKKVFREKKMSSPCILHVHFSTFWGISSWVRLGAISVYLRYLPSSRRNSFSLLSEILYSVHLLWFLFPWINTFMCSSLFTILDGLCVISIWWERNPATRYNLGHFFPGKE